MIVLFSCESTGSGESSLKQSRRLI